MEDIYIEYLKTGGMFLKIQQSKKQFLIFYMSGFLAGILYANMVSDSYLESYGVFSEYFLRQFQITEIIPEEYLGYLLRIRIIPAGVLLAAGCTRWKSSAWSYWDRDLCGGSISANFLLPPVGSCLSMVSIFIAASQVE